MVTLWPMYVNYYIQRALKMNMKVLHNLKYKRTCDSTLSCINGVKGSLLWIHTTFKAQNMNDLQIWFMRNINLTKLTVNSRVNLLREEKKMSLTRRVSQCALLLIKLTSCTPHRKLWRAWAVKCWFANKLSFLRMTKICGDSLTSSDH